MLSTRIPNSVHRNAIRLSQHDLNTRTLLCGIWGTSTQLSQLSARHAFIATRTRLVSLIVLEFSRELFLFKFRQFATPCRTSGGNYFNDFCEKQLTKLRAVFKANTI